MLPMPNLLSNVRRELDCTPTLARINTDYDPGSVVSTAQSNNMTVRHFDFSFFLVFNPGDLYYLG